MTHDHKAPVHNGNLSMLPLQKFLTFLGMQRDELKIEANVAHEHKKACRRSRQPDMGSNEL
jgi:hypothetical protein